MTTLLDYTVFLPYTLTSFALDLLAPTEAEVRADPIVARLLPGGADDELTDIAA